MRRMGEKKKKRTRENLALVMRKLAPVCLTTNGITIHKINTSDNLSVHVFLESMGNC